MNKVPGTAIQVWRLTLAAALGATAVLILSGSALAAIPPELPMVQRLGTGVRALGMGGAFTAVADDGTALASNPAGLAQVRRLEFGAAFESRSFEANTEYLGHRESTTLDKSRIHSASFAYPFPTWRGALVIGFAYDCATPFDQEYFRAGAGPGVELEEESIFEDGSLGAWRAGLGAEVAPNLMLGVSGAIMTGSSRRERDFSFRGTGGADRENTSTVTDLDLTAVTGTLGALYRTPAGVRVGFALHLPESYDADGRATEDVRRYQASGDTLDYYDDYFFKDEITLPFRTSVGISYAPPGALEGLVVSAQWDYADWKQIDYAGPIRTDDREYAYRATHDLRAGVEYTPPRTALRVRAGYLSQPVAYRLIATDVFMGEASPSRFEKDRRYFTFGVGADLDPSFAIDLAYLQGSFERSGQAPDRRITVEEFRDRRILLGATFRL